MIQPNKVRIGNIFKEEYTEKLIRVIEIRQKSITFSEKFRGKWQANPIELTDDILLKCGFVDNKINLGLNNFHVTTYGLATYGNVGFVCMYLHQLQNLYFVITGKELEVNLK
jgi:hypothetical protein